jgi:magnesium transporter
MTERGLQLLQDTVERLLRRNATANLIKILNKTHPADIAYLFMHLNDRHAKTVFELLPDVETAAEVLSEMEPLFRTDFVQNVQAERLASILDVMADDDAADVLADLPEDLRNRMLVLMTDEETEEVAELLSYPEDTAGRIMVSDFVALPESMTAADAIGQVRKASDEAEMVFYLYVVDEQGRLAGVISLRQLVIASSETMLEEIMTQDTVKVQVTTDQEEAARMVSRYNLLAMPVVDHNDVLVGIITVDDVIDVLREEATEDILKMAGTSDVEIESFSVLKSVKVRLPWLFAAWIGGVVAMYIIGYYEAQYKDDIYAFAALAAFIPVIMGMGGNIGTQSLSLTVRGLATGRLDPQLLGKIVAKEVGVGTLLGLAYGILLAGVGWFINHNITLGITVGIAILANMAMAAVIGTGLPLVFAKMRIDPAVASGPFVTTSIDIVGVAFYFLIAGALLS